MKLAALILAVMAVGALAVRPAAVLALIVIAAVGGFLAGATGRQIWRGGQ